MALYDNSVDPSNENSSSSEHLKKGVYMNFGCQRSESGLFTSQKADGIMGMADVGTCELFKNN